MRKATSRATTKVGALVGVLVLMLGPVGSAGAADVDLSFVLTQGGLTISASPIPLPATGGTGIEGVWDDVTGDFEGEFIIADQQVALPITTPVAGTLDIIISMAASPVTGTIDPTTGDVDLQTSIDLEFFFIDLDVGGGVIVALGTECHLAPIDLALSSTPDGVPFDPNADPATFTVTDEGFEAPLGECSGGNASFLQSVEDGLNTRFALPTTETTAGMVFETGDIVAQPPIEPPTTTTTTTVAPAPPPAAPIAAAPRVTG